MKKKLLYVLAGLAAILLAVGGWYGYLYAATPAHLREPMYEHYHFRTQIIVNGKAVNFGAGKFQQEYDKTSCSAEVGAHPIDFHDNVDQMTHAHWQGMTGGEFLKYFGWNLIGGSDNVLGRRYDDGFLKAHTIKTLGNLLPTIPKDATFYVYVGDKDSYQQKKWDDFLKQDLETFFGKQSSVPNAEEGSAFLKWLFPKAAAHGGVDDGDETTDEAELTRINNLIGNVAIFVQKNEPTKQQIQARFNNLVPLKDSTCGG